MSKFTTLDKAMTKATGMNKDERKAHRVTVKELMEQRRNETDPAKKEEIVAQINEMMGWK